MFLKQKVIFGFFLYCLNGLLAYTIAQDISGIYLTHKDTEGGRSVVEIFQYNGKYYVYGLKNLENEPIEDSCNKNQALRHRKSVGNVFAYNYQENEEGQFVGGVIYNFYNCKTYYGKIVPKENDRISFIGALDSHYWLSRSYTWRKLDTDEIAQYEIYRRPLIELLQTIQDTIESK